MTVLEVIQRSTEFLGRKKVDSPRLQAEFLLAHILGMARMQLYLNFERILSPVELEALRVLVKRRGGREPLQHILGQTCFCGLDMAVNRQVLIPRPETELLAEQGWLFLNQRASIGAAAPDRASSQAAPDQPETRRSPTALDFGTGSGCIAIALAVNCPTAKIAALDVAPDALALAQANANRHGVAEQIRFLLGDRLTAVPKQAEYDLLVANPPYVPSGEIENLEPEVREYDPRRALDGGQDGLDFYRCLASETGLLLRTAGKIMMEFGDGQAEAVRSLFQAENWIVERILNDYSHQPRILIARRPD